MELKFAECRIKCINIAEIRSSRNCSHCHSIQTALGPTQTDQVPNAYKTSKMILVFAFIDMKLEDATQRFITMFTTACEPCHQADESNPQPPTLFNSYPF
jgi:cytochrome c2